MRGTHGSPRCSAGPPPSQVWAPGGGGTVSSMSAPAVPPDAGQVTGQADSRTDGPLSVAVGTLVLLAHGDSSALFPR